MTTIPPDSPQKVPVSGPAGKPPARRGPVRRLARMLGFAAVIVCACFFGGFLWFADWVTALTPPADPKADAIVVLTGGSQRIDQAVELLRSGAGARLLISGVHPATSRNQIRRLTGSSDALFACCVDIGYDALDTIGNAAETVRWIHERNYRRILVVTNNYHMPRSLFELRRVAPGTEFIPYPVVRSDLKAKNWFADPDVLRALLVEYGKFTAASLRGILGLGNLTGLRGANSGSQHAAGSP